jgi:outer membrane protein assembly factor BamD (BamD/ComL family)
MPRDEERCREALAALGGFISEYPTAADADVARAHFAELKDHLAHMNYERAAFYDRGARRPMAALLAYRGFVGEFPDSAWTAKAAERIAVLEKEVEKQDEQEQNPR